jgi:hypothetical protein
MFVVAIGTLALALAAGLSPAAPAFAAKAESVAALAALCDSAPCAECHKEIHARWLESTHASPLLGTGGATAAALWKTVVDGLMKWPGSGVKSRDDIKVEHLMICAKCHLPQLADASDAVAREIVEAVGDWQAGVDGGDPAKRDKAAAKLGTLNIGCTVCHNRNAVIHKLVDGFPEAGVVYGSKDGAHPGAFARMKKGSSLASPIFCGQCHGFGPTLDLENPVQCATGYGSYLFAYAAEGGRETCQDCHMAKGGRGHGMKGADNGAIEMSTEAFGYVWRNVTKNVPRVVVEVRLTNRTGHALPEGPPSSRQLVVEVVASTDDNAALFTGRRSYRSSAQRLGRGKTVSENPHESSGFVESSALPPGKTVRERFDFLLPSEESLGGKVSIRIRLLEVGGTIAGSRIRQEVRRDLVVGESP